MFYAFMIGVQLVFGLLWVLANHSRNKWVARAREEYERAERITGSYLWLYGKYVELKERNKQ